MSLALASLRAHPQLQPRRGTLSPLVPLSLRAFKGEGERKTEACTCARAQVHASSFGTGGKGDIRTEGDVGANAPTSPSSSVLGRRGNSTPDSSRGIGMTLGVGGGGWKGATSSGAWASPRSYFDGAQHERPRTRGRRPRETPLRGRGKGHRPRFLAGHRNDIRSRGWGG